MYINPITNVQCSGANKTLFDASMVNSLYIFSNVFFIDIFKDISRFLKLKNLKILNYFLRG